MLSLVNEKVGNAFEAKGLDRAFAAVSISNRPDLSDLQCNGALQAAKILKRRPLDIANEMKEALEGTELFSKVTIDGPGFVNLTLSDNVILEILFNGKTEKIAAATPQRIIIDYGGPNVAKPLHVGHLRSAIIGEAIKRIARELGHEVIADIHLGDWGTPMGMLIAKLKDDHPEWPYFSPDYLDKNGLTLPPLSADDLNTLYPQAAAKFKEDESFAEKAREATALLQAGHPGYRFLWKHFVNLSVESIEKDFGALDVHFDLWLGESDADSSNHEVISTLVEKGIAKESQGALVVDVSLTEDKTEIPPLILQKKDGAATYATTDLATIFQRVRDYKPDHILYVVDQRQFLHFTQVFRAAEKAGYIQENALEHIGFGTMNGKDGKPFKTRAGGVMRLGDLIQNAIDLALHEAGFSETHVDQETKEMVTKVAIAAIKFGDLANLRTTDYIFDLDEFIRFDGRTGPYIQYATVRAGSVLEKAAIDRPLPPPATCAFSHKAERNLALGLMNFPHALQRAFERRMPSDLCDYAYDLANKFSVFYHDCPIASEENESIKGFRLYLTQKTEETLKRALHCLAIPTPKKMLRAAAPQEGAIIDRRPTTTLKTSP